MISLKKEIGSFVNQSSMFDIFIISKVLKESLSGTRSIVSV